MLGINDIKMAPPLKRLRQAGSDSSESEGENDSGEMGSSGLSEIGDDKTEYESDSGSQELEAEEDDGIEEEEEDDEYEQEEEDVMQEDELYRDADMDEEEEEIIQSSPATLPSRANKITLRKTSAPTHSTIAQSSTQRQQQHPNEVTATASSTVPSPSFKLKLKLADRKQLPSSPLTASASQNNSKDQQAYRTSKQISRLKKEASLADSDTASSDRDFDDVMLPNARSEGEDEDKEDEEEDSLTSESSDEPVDFSRLTNRQRAKYDETVNTESDLLSLPNEIQRKTKYTEAEEQLKKSESARRRKNQSEQKLEEQKIETINKLLKRQAKSTRRGARPSGVDTPASDDETASQAQFIAPADIRPKLPPNMSRWINTARGSVLAIPEGWEGIEIVGVNV